MTGDYVAGIQRAIIIGMMGFILGNTTVMLKELRNELSIIRSELEIINKTLHQEEESRGRHQ